MKHIPYGVPSRKELEILLGSEEDDILPNPMRSAHYNLRFASAFLLK